MDTRGRFLRRRAGAATGLALLGCVVVAPTPVATQTLTGDVGEPGRWLVRLVDAEGRERGLGLSDPQGTFALETAGTVPVTLVAERVGRARRSTPAFTPGADPVPAFDSTGEPLDLRGVDVPAQDVCRLRPDPSTPAGRALEVARVALASSALLVEGGAVRFDATRHLRTLGSDGRTVRSEAPVDTVSAATRIGAAADPRDLVERGFVREDSAGDYRFFAPDPQVVVSDAFLDSHCFRLRPDGGPALVGLGFEPVDDADPRPDVGGVLWMEADTGRPLLLEFAYRRLDLGFPLAGVGGRTLFAELPDGSWVTPETWLRLPLLEVRVAEGDEARWELGGLQEEGVRLLAVRTAADAWSLAAENGTVAGRVTLHDGGEPLPDARVMLVGTAREAITDADGRYRIDGLLEGVYSLTVRHPRLDDLPVGTGTRRVAVRPGETSRMDLAAPRPEEAALQLCGGVGVGGPAVILSGRVVDSLTAEPLVGVPLTLRYRDPRRAGSPYHEARISSGTGGEYVYCDLPPSTNVRVRAVTPRSTGENDEILVTPASGSVRRDLVVALSTEQDPGGVFGTVREFGSGAPLEAVRVRVKDTPVSALTNANGFFAIPGLERGLHVLEVSLIGYESREIVVRLSGTNAFKVDVELAIDAIPLEGITVTAVPRRTFGDMVDLHRRMELGFGEFVMQEELQKGSTLASSLQGRNGVRTVASQDRMGGEYLVLRRARDLVDPSAGPLGFDWCYPAVWVDGQPWSRRKAGGVGHDPVDFTQFLSVDMEAVEIYKGAAGVPGEFGGGDAACGAVVIWTRRGSVLTKGRAGGAEAGGTLQWPDVH